jgi:phosphopantothenoylcysteine decarboxylase
VCPAMNTMMYEHPCTLEHIQKLKSWGITVMDTQVKVLACGDKGLGAMASAE